MAPFLCFVMCILLKRMIAAFVPSKLIPRLFSYQCHCSQDPLQSGSVSGRT